MHPGETIWCLRWAHVLRSKQYGQAQLSSLHLHSYCFIRFFAMSGKFQDCPTCYSQGHASLFINISWLFLVLGALISTSKLQLFVLFQYISLLMSVASILSSSLISS